MLLYTIFHLKINQSFGLTKFSLSDLLFFSSLLLLGRRSRSLVSVLVTRLVLVVIIVIVILLIAEVSLIIVVVITAALAMTSLDVIIVVGTHHIGIVVLRVVVRRVYICEAHLGDLVNLFLGILRIHTTLGHHLRVHH